MGRCYQLMPLITTTQILSQKLTLEEIVICNMFGTFETYLMYRF